MPGTCPRGSRRVSALISKRDSHGEPLPDPSRKRRRQASRRKWIRGRDPWSHGESRYAVFREFGITTHGTGNEINDVSGRNGIATAGLADLVATALKPGSATRWGRAAFWRRFFYCRRCAVACSRRSPTGPRRTTFFCPPHADAGGTGSFPRRRHGQHLRRRDLQACLMWHRICAPLQSRSIFKSGDISYGGGRIRPHCRHILAPAS